MREFESTLSTVTAQFAVPGTFLRYRRYGQGLINDTFLSEFSEQGSVRRYILQHINPSVFKHPEHVMENVAAVTRHIEAGLRAQGIENPENVAPILVYTRSGQPFYRDEQGASWRMYHFIEAGEVFETVRDAQHAYEVGRGLGKFQTSIADMDPSTLHDVLPGFHDTPRYLAGYDEALGKNIHKRAVSVKQESSFVHQRRFLALLLRDPIQADHIPLRAVHNDPKVNNIMIHTATRKALCMLDLDTVMPGFAPVDFGDCVRSAANPAGENAQDLDGVRLDLSLFEAIASGYLREAAGFLTPEEIDALPLSVQTITFELGLRFLTDYLRGDTYFKITYPSQNLDRARVQFRLLESIEASKGQMASLVARLTSQG
jgi:Ser/Thr protein kinase RdoA (MazF antagonist)